MKPLQLPSRISKPRHTGITAITDTGISLAQLQGILEDYSNFLDIAKLGLGTFYITPNLTAKLELYQKFNIITYPGGTLFEKFYSQSQVDKYFEYLYNSSIQWVEISSGTIDIPLSERVSIIEKIKDEFIVISEVGSKNTEKSLMMSPDTWINEIKALLDAGSRYIILEGRASGTSGIYEPNGNIRSMLIKEIITEIDSKRIIFEAPKAKDQNFFINLLGANVNLGNINIMDLLLLETQRQGLRYETFSLTDKQ